MLTVKNVYSGISPLVLVARGQNKLFYNGLDQAYAGVSKNVSNSKIFDQLTVARNTGRNVEFCSGIPRLARDISTNIRLTGENAVFLKWYGSREADRPLIS